MALIYTTNENIARKLRGRLSIASQPTVDTTIGDILGYGNAVSGQVVDNGLIDQIGEQEESYINLLLCQVYEIPLKLTSPITRGIMSSIAEGYIISSLLQVHFEGQNAGVQASESGGAAMDLRRKSEFMLASILASSNIFLPTMPAPQNNMSFTPQMQPLVLPEEVPIGTRPDLITNNYVLVGLPSDIANVSSSNALFKEAADLFSSNKHQNCNLGNIYG